MSESEDAFSTQEHRDNCSCQACDPDDAYERRVECFYGRGWPRRPAIFW